MLDGDRMAKSMYKVKFGENVDTAELCTVDLKEEDITRLQSAIEDLYYFEFVAGIYTIYIDKIKPARVNFYYLPI